MKKSTKIIGCAAVIFLALSSATVAAEEHQSYGEKFINKASQGFANITTGWIELPKNVFNMTTDYTVFGGITLGVLRGAFHTVTRTVVGVGELLTSPIPTDDYVTPGYIWERFSEDTRYFGIAYPLHWTSYGPFDDGEPLRTE